MNKYLSRFLVLYSVILLVGCAGMADSMNKMAGLGVVSESKSSYDNSKTIRVSPNWLYDSKENWTANNIKLGARWNSKSPKYIAIDLSYDSNTSGYSPTYMGITGIEININGKKSSYKSSKPTSLDSGSYNSVSKTIYTKSSNSVIIPLETLKNMVQSKDVRIRINTNKGYEDAVFSIERSSSGQSTALLSIREFLNKLQKYEK